jgi:hypothetical protein
VPPLRARIAKIVTLMRSSFSRSYGCILPSSLTTVLPIALVFSTCPPVSVWGTGAVPTHCWAFLGSMGLMTSPVSARHRASELTDPTFIGSLLHAYPKIQRLGSSTLLRPPSITRLRWVGSLHECSSPLVPGFGLGADTAVPEYQPVVHRLRLSASP